MLLQANIREAMRDLHDLQKWVFRDGTHRQTNRRTWRLYDWPGRVSEICEMPKLLNDYSWAETETETIVNYFYEHSEWKPVLKPHCWFEAYKYKA